MLKNNIFTKILAVVLFVISLAVNALAGTRILGGNTTAEVSDAYPNLFAPAGVTFAIWGIIYLLLVVFCVRIFLRPAIGNRKSRDFIQQLVWCFIVVTVLNTAWLFAWQYRVLGLSIILIIAMLLTLNRASWLISQQKKLQLFDFVTVQVPFNAYFGWITIAMIANITAWLVSVHWSGWGISPEIWTIAVLILGAIIGFVIAWRRNAPTYLAVFVWAYFGIWLKHISSSGFDQAYPMIINALVLLLAGLSTAVAAIVLKRQK